MGKTYSKKFRHRKGNREVAYDDTIFVPLSEIYISDSTWAKLMERDHGQIEQMRKNFEDGRGMVRVVLRPRAGGGYNVEDGRHRVIAAKLADTGCIEALVVGS
ncbi:MAG: hypothetical protein KC777_06980 [Cyanobacteria bacterium HKST-UBA02]|nr:hypothetical protein [Cyanobacteria bacterium HKST-UBA02]